MNFVELAIIYLALGAPLGVYHAVTHWEESGTATFIASILNVFLWPLAAGFIAYLHFRNAHRRLKNITDDRCLELCRLADRHLSVEKAFEVRLTVERYTEIGKAYERPIGVSSVDSLAEIDAIDNAAIAGPCFARRNREKLYAHRIDARKDLIAAIASMSTEFPQVVRPAIELAESLDDHEGKDELTTLSAVSIAGPNKTHNAVSLAA